MSEGIKSVHADEPHSAVPLSAFCDSSLSLNLASMESSATISRFGHLIICGPFGSVRDLGASARIESQRGRLQPWKPAVENS
jgi:hypothetical protein